MLYILLVVTIIITLMLAFRAKVLRSADKVMQKMFTVYCEDAVVTKIDTITNEVSGHTDMVLFLDYSIDEKIGDEIVKKNGKTRWFVTPDKGGYGHEVGDIFPIMIAPAENRAVSLDVWERMLKDRAQYTIGMNLGICAIVLIVVQIIRGMAA